MVQPYCAQSRMCSLCHMERCMALSFMQLSVQLANMHPNKVLQYAVHKTTQPAGATRALRGSWVVIALVVMSYHGLVDSALQALDCI